MDSHNWIKILKYSKGYAYKHNVPPDDFSQEVCLHVLEDPYSNSTRAYLLRACRIVLRKMQRQGKKFVRSAPCLLTCSSIEQRAIMLEEIGEYLQEIVEIYDRGLTPRQTQRRIKGLKK